MPNYTGTEGDDAVAGSIGDDSFAMLGGNDTVFASSGNDQVSGGDGNDHLEGSEGNDIINGDGGDDFLVGGHGADIVDGGAGNDLFSVRDDYPNGSELAAGDQFIGGDGFDRIVFSGTYSGQWFDITGLTISGIEAITAEWVVKLSFAQFSSLTQASGIFRLDGSGSLDLTGNRLVNGTINFGAGNDTVTLAGNSGGANLNGGPGDDVLIGSEGSDSLQGGDGNDTLEGRGGNDYLDGGAGNDTMLGGDGSDTFFKGYGTDIMDGGAGDDSFQLSIAEGLGAEDQVIGGAGYDTLWIEQNGIYQGWQDFSQYQISGIERFEGGNASFIMSVANLAQFQYFQVGQLQLSTAGTVTYGTSFRVHDYVTSSFGNTVDLSAGGTDNFRVIGGAGNDIVFGSGGTDELLGGGGNDELHGGGSFDELLGGAGVDWLDGGAGNDRLYIGPGEAVSAGDRFSGGSGTDDLLVGQDPDGNWDGSGATIDLSMATIDGDIENLHGNAVRLTVAQAGSFGFLYVQSLHLANGGTLDLTNIAFSGNLYLSDSGNHVTASNVTSNYGINAYGGAGNDTIIGSSQTLNDQLRGGGGNDSLYGGAGDDLLDGQAGADTMDGGTGNDSYWVDNAADVVAEAAGGGNDSVNSYVSFTLGAGIEALGLLGADSINATGNALDNQLSGNSGNNILDGGAGADNMVGGNGNDTYVVDNVNDMVSEWGADGVDQVNSSVSYTIPFFVENLTLTGAAAINGTGSDWANTLQGNSNANVLSGQGGVDTIFGGDGNDTLYGGWDNDSLSGQNGDDSLDGGDGNDSLDGGAGSDTASYDSSDFGVAVSLAIAGAQNTGHAGAPGAGTDTLVSIENLTGSDFGDILTGNVGANVLNGGAGNDSLDGGAGNDILDGGSGIDNATYANAAGAITVSLAIAGAQNTGAAGTDTIVNVENLVGSGFADTLTGNSGNNSLQGGAGDDSLHGGDGADWLDGSTGNDILNGGAGVDTANYAGSAAGVTVNLNTLTAQNTVGAGTDTLSGVENLIGSGHADTLTGDSNANVLEGNGGNDTLNGGAGTDTASYWTALAGVTVNLGVATAQNTIGAGMDTLSNFENLLGSTFNDTLTGNSSDNVIDGRQGNDTLNGGAGTDTVSYAAANLGVIVNLSLAGAQDTIGAGSDTLSNFENLTGSAFADTLTGNSGDNLLNGLGGNDSFDGGTGTDTVTYANAAAGVTVSLADGGVQNTVGSGNNILASIENLTGSAFNDTLAGDAGNNLLDGGAGSDTASYAGAPSGVTVSLANAGAQNTVGAGTDTLSNFENLTGSAYNDTLTGNGSANVLTGGAGDDSFRDTAANLNGDTIADLSLGDTIVITDATQAGFTFSLSGNLLTYTGGSLTLQGSPSGQLVASAAAGGGVQLTLVSATEGDDTITGTELADDIDGLGGSDIINGLGGNDTLIGGTGNDTLDGGDGDDQIDGGDGDDLITDGAGSDTILAGSGFDNINASIGAGGDSYDGGEGFDAVLYNAALAGVIADFSGTTDQVTSVGGSDAAGIGTDILMNIETVLGSGFDDTMVGDELENTFVGRGGDDMLYGGGGNDQLTGSDGDDHIDGGAGLDRALYSSATTGLTISLALSGPQNTGQGIDTLISIENLSGGSHDDVLIGNDELNQMSGQLGSDQIFGAGGNDSLHGGDGDDHLDGGADNDNLNGGLGDDLLEGGQGQDSLSGGDGTDTASYAAASSGVTVNLAITLLQMTGGAGADTLTGIENVTGSAFNDTLSGNAANNVIEGGGGNDLVDGGDGYDAASYAGASAGVSVNLALFGGQDTGGAGIDTLSNVENVSGSAFADTLLGNAARNRIEGGAGNDVVDGGADADVMIGGQGNDGFYVDDAADQLIEFANQGDDTAFVLGTYTLAQGVSIETLVALNQSSTDPLILTGNEFGQSLYGNLGDNYLNGGQGNDYLVGLDGNDGLLGGTGADNLAGGTGNDIYYVDEAGDRVFEYAGEGDNDLVVATASYVLSEGAAVETLSAEQTGAAINLTGNEYGQSLYGNAGNNVLTGLGGSDYLVGGAGNDLYYVDTSDFIAEAAGGGDDWIFVADSYILREGNEIETLVALDQSSTAPVDLTGNEYGQSLYGSAGVNSMNGGAGNDYLVGLGGNDFLTGGTGSDNLAGGTGNDIYYVDGGDAIFEGAGEGDDMAVASESFALGSNQAVETLAAAEGSASINLTGNGLAQSLYGNAGANILTTGGGNDYLVGGGGSDTFILSNAAGIAAIADYAAGEAVDVTQWLSVAGGTDVVGGGYLRVTSAGQLQVDASGGGNGWTTIATISGSAPVTIRYLSGGSATDLTVARSGQAQAIDSKVAAANSDPFALQFEPGLVTDALAGWNANPVSHDPAGLEPIAPQLDIYDIV